MHTLCIEFTHIINKRLTIDELGDIEAFDFEEFSYTLYILTKSKTLYAIKIENLESSEV